MSSPAASGRGDACPCGSGRPYRACCGPFHAGTTHPATPEQLMRARYSAFVLHNESFLLVTWLPDTRPSRIRFDPDLTWTGLDIIATTGGTPFQREGTVEFVARYEVRRRGQVTPGVLHEVSQFIATDQWYYVEGIVGRRP